MARFERWLEVKRIFEEALDTAPQEREAFLARVCTGDAELRGEVEALLDAPALPTSSLAGLLGLPERRDEPNYSEGDQIDHLTIVREVGKGGMGAVYEARDTRNNDRRVAVKVLFSRAVSLSQDKRLAGLSHPSIVTFHDSGETPEGLPYFVFEFIEGEPITVYCERRRLGVVERLRLFQKICEAVAYAHQRLVIHCDLKPENILVTATGELKLLDFGIAKEVGAAGSVAGEPSPITLPFASPEQITEEETTTLSDVYSLGVLFAVLLTGRLPYRRARTVAELRDAILYEVPGRLSDLAAASRTPEDPAPYTAPPAVSSPADLARRLRGDLDAIAAKALSKEPGRRYQSAADLWSDVTHHLAVRPVEARAGARGYRAFRFLKRNRGAVAALVAAVFVLLGFLFVLFRQRQEALAQRDDARQEAARAEETSKFLVDLFRVADPQRQPGAVSALELLDKAVTSIAIRFRDQPKTRVRLLNTLGETYQVIGLFPESERCHTMALTVGRSALDLNDPEMAETLTDLATLRQRQGKSHDAELMHREALRIREHQTPRDDVKIAASLYGVGTTLQGEQRFQEAEPFLRKALAMLQKIPNGDQGEVAQAMNALGALLAGAQRPDEAEPVMRDCLALRERLYGPVHPLVATSLANLALVLSLEAKFQEALSLQQRSIAITDKVYGPSHPNVVNGLVGLGAIYLAEKDYAHAAAVYQDTLAKTHPNTPKEHPRGVAIRVGLARAFLGQGQVREADALLDEALRVSRVQFGPDNSQAADVMRAQAESDLLQNNLKTAEERLQNAIKIYSREQGNSSYKVVAARGALGDVFVQEKRLSEAEPLLLAYYARAVPRDRSEALEHLIRCYDLEGAREKAAAYRRRQASLPQVNIGDKSGSSPTASASPH
jgi:eukaryotic-like serine/threonine-protein kinase